MLGLTSGSVLIYQWWTRKQELERLKSQLAYQEQEAHRQYQLQNNYLISTADLVNSYEVHAFFSDLLNTYARKFSKSKNLGISHLPLKFAGLYSELKTSNGYGEMGRCFPHQVIYPVKQKEANISLNRLYLLNKLGHDCYFTSNPQYGDYTYLDISFDKMIETCAHEIAHYIQLVKHDRSSCESDLVLNSDRYNAKLACEHEKFTQEIYQLIKQDYSLWERKWKKI